jgi:titin
MRKSVLLLLTLLLTSSLAFGAHSVTLTWTNSADPGGTYSALRGTTPGGESATPIATNISSGWVDTSAAVVAGATLYYEVTYTLGSQTATSNEASATVPVAAATNLKAVAQ